MLEIRYINIIKREITCDFEGTSRLKRHTSHVTLRPVSCSFAVASDTHYYMLFIKETST